jgi:hypothetical protein
VRIICVLCGVAAETKVVAGAWGYVFCCQGHWLDMRAGIITGRGLWDDIEMRLEEMRQEDVKWIRVAQNGLFSENDGFFGFRKRRKFLD